MDTTLLIGILIVAMALIFAFSNGFNDTANIVATVIGTRALTPVWAITIASVFGFIGAYFLGTAVAGTLAKGIIDPSIISGDKYGIIIVFATLLGATAWNVICTVYGFPVSASHALIGGFVGAGVIARGFEIVQWISVLLIFIVLIVAPIAGFIGTYIITKIAYFLSRNAAPKINKFYRTLQIFASMGFALSYGANDAPKTMGIIVFSLVVLGLYEPQAGILTIPLWVTVACALSITFGIILGGKSVIKTVGMNIYRIRQINGFCVQAAGAVVIYFASMFGMPVSSTHIISGGIMGTGSAERIKAVRWGMSFDIFLVWVITMPATAVVSAIIYFLLLNGVKLLGI